MKNTKSLSLRPFIGSKNFDESKEFYEALGFEEVSLGPTMSLFKREKVFFYLQDYFHKRWCHNTMLFWEVEDVQLSLEEVKALDLPRRFKGVKLSEIVHNDWGSEFFLHDPAGILWHIGSFNS